MIFLSFFSYFSFSVAFFSILFFPSFLSLFSSFFCSLQSQALEEKKKEPNLKKTKMKKDKREFQSFIFFMKIYLAFHISNRLKSLKKQQLCFYYNFHFVDKEEHLAKTFLYLYHPNMTWRESFLLKKMRKDEERNRRKNKGRENKGTQ